MHMLVIQNFLDVSGAALLQQSQFRIPSQG